MTFIQKTFFLSVTLLFGGCSSVTTVELNESFPSVLSEPKEITTSIILTDEFKNFVGTPNDKTTLNLGPSQVNLFRSAFKGLFSKVYFLNDDDIVPEDTEMIITLSNIVVEVATPSENYLNVFEVWIKYNLEIQDREGKLISNWFMPAYGKTPKSLLYSKENAISQAATVALRDAGAKLLLDFYRIPSVAKWIGERA